MVALSLAAFGLCAAGSAPMAADDFYSGKTIRMLVGSDAGGNYDSYARLVARHMGKHIPGNPTIIVQNMPGAASIKMANYIASGAPRDGTVIGATFGGLPTAPLTAPNEAQFDATQMNWIGNATKELYVGYVWHTTPVKTYQDAMTHEVIMGGSSAGTFSVDTALVANEYFGTKFRIVTGYKGGADTQLALEKGEVESVMGTAWNSVKRQTDWINNNKIRVIIQYGLTRSRQFPDVPLFLDFAKTDEQRQTVKFMVGNLVHGKPFVSGPGIPAERVSILRRAFDTTMRDPEFLQEIEKSGLDINEPMTGEEVAGLVGEEARTPRAVLENIAAIVDKFKQGIR